MAPLPDLPWQVGPWRGNRATLPGGPAPAGLPPATLPDPRGRRCRFRFSLFTLLVLQLLLGLAFCGWASAAVGLRVCRRCGCAIHVRGNSLAGKTLVTRREVEQTFLSRFLAERYGVQCARHDEAWVHGIGIEDPSPGGWGCAAYHWILKQPFRNDGALRQYADAYPAEFRALLAVTLNPPWELNLRMSDFLAYRCDRSAADPAQVKALLHDLDELCRVQGGRRWREVRDEALASLEALDAR
ncbi:MAG: hypothetical protein HZA54_07520 [Planctomycetes bacterium]|nr:hypothetical protein [Planctomycetota bacterium]